MIKTVGLETAKLLKDAKFKQRTSLWWVKGRMNFGYEGEWNIDESDEYFLFDHEINRELDSYVFNLPWPEALNNKDISDEEWDRENKKFENKKKKMAKDNVWAAPSSDELLEELPFYLVQYGVLTLKKNHLPRPPHAGYHCLYQKTVNNKESSVTICADTSAEALAQMYIWLHKEGLLEKN